MKSIKVFSFIALLLLAAAGPAKTADATAMLVASRGDVTATTDGVDRVLAQGDSIFEADAIATGSKSFAVLQFVDGAKVTIRPNSKLVVKEYIFNGGDSDAATLSLVEGGLRVITGAVAKAEPENYKIETPVALMGVRGTEFAVVLCDDGSVCQEEGLEAE